MKKILLLGDSIRMGYCKYVRAALAGECEVVFPEENCRFAEYFLRYLHEWNNQLCKEQAPDVVHWNAGLWDVLELFDEGCLTPPEVYGIFIEKICVRMKKLFPNAKIIFATNTPIIEAKYGKNFMRHNANIEQYNAIAVEIVRRYGFEVNDLYAKTKDIGEEYHSDATHFNNPLGAEYMTNLVLPVVCEAAEIACPRFTYTEKL